MRLKELIIFLLIVGLSTPGIAWAQEELNTGVLPVLWYSSTKIYEGDQIKIFGGIQNHSGVKFSGIAVFYVGGQEISRKSFTSSPETLIELSADWLAIMGDHEAEFKIVDLKPPSPIWSTSSGKNDLKVARRITTEMVKESAEKTANTVVVIIDNTANSLADRITEYKEEMKSKPSGGNVLGTSTAYEKFASAAENPAAKSVFALLLTFVSALLRQWQWTLGAILLFTFYLALRPRS